MTIHTRIAEIAPQRDRGERIGFAMDRARNDVVGIGMALAHQPSPWMTRRLQWAVRRYERWIRIFDRDRKKERPT